MRSLRRDRRGALATPHRRGVHAQSATARVEPERPLDWQEFADDERVTDVCPNCITAGEHADLLFREAEFTILFDDAEGV
jgi:hypothetical protein